MTANGNVFTRYFQQFNWSAILDDVFSKFVSLVFLCLLFWVAKKILHLFVTRLIAPSLKLSRQDVARQKTIMRLIENLLNYVLYFLLLYWILSILGLPVSSLLAGFFILLERQLDVGDNVRLTNGAIKIAGIVVSVGIRTTQVRDADGTLHFVPNRNITVVSNLSRGDMRVLIDIPIYAETDLDEIYRIIAAVNQEAVPEHPEVLKEPDILGPQMTASGQFYFRISLIVASGMQASLYHIFYRLYHEALLKEGVALPTLAPVAGNNGKV